MLLNRDVSYVSEPNRGLHVPIECRPGPSALRMRHCRSSAALGSGDACPCRHRRRDFLVNRPEATRREWGHGKCGIRTLSSQCRSHRPGFIRLSICRPCVSIMACSSSTLLERRDVVVWNPRPHDIGAGFGHRRRIAQEDKPDSDCYEESDWYGEARPDHLRASPSVLVGGTLTVR